MIIIIITILGKRLPQSKYDIKSNQTISSILSSEDKLENFSKNVLNAQIETKPVLNLEL